MARSAFSRARQAALIVSLGTATPCAIYAAYCGMLAASGNFHAVKAGQLYRSAQLDKAEFGKVIENYHIKSVLNLRGPNPESAWYQDELAAMREHAIDHYDVGISAHQPPTPDQMARILVILRTAAKPLLIHCKAGSDRTGLVTALYRYAIAGEPAEQAASELSLRFGHFPYLTSQTGAMDDSFSTYVLDAVAAPSTSR
jgi:protein tyrosine/serine phosphatase